MLPEVHGLFMLVRELANKHSVTEVSASRWLVQRHGLAPLAARAGASAFRDDLVRATVAWARTTAVLEPLVATLTDRGVRVAPIKGVAYATTLYEAPAERPMSDIDMLVVPHALAEQALVKARFARVPGQLLHHATTWVRDEVVVDLHRSILAPGRGRIDLDAVWSRMSPGWPAGAEALDPLDALVFHLVHMARNRLRVPLIQVVDFARLAARVADPDAALVRASEWRVRPAVELALRFCRSILADRQDRPAGWLGPTHEELARFEEPTVGKKIAFDVATAGSVLQLVSRAVGYGASVIARRLRPSS